MRCKDCACSDVCYYKAFNDVRAVKRRDDVEKVCKSFVHRDSIKVDAVEVVWKPVLGFEGLYEINNLGKVRNHKGETLKQGIKRTNCTCYKLVNLWKDGHYHKKYIHRLIAEAFIPNPDNLPMINHKDEDGTNNAIENLEWCTREYNVNYGTAKERRAKKIRGVKHTEEHNKKISESMKRHFAKMDLKGE